MFIPIIGMFHLESRIPSECGFPEQRMVNTGEAGYIGNYTQAITGPNGVKLKWYYY
jgi:hypothetical protein